MKTSEFRGWLINNAWQFEENEDYFHILYLAKVYKTRNEVKDLSICDGKGELFAKIYEYVQTPLNEREEEKKYILISKLKTIGGNSLYVSRSSFSGNLFFGNFIESFTQKEIDAMPFDTNFFIKEEVK